MFSLTAEQWAGAGVTTLVVIDNIYQRFLARKKSTKVEIDQNLVSDAKAWQARAESMSKLAADNLALYRDEHEQHMKTRDFYHTKLGNDQALLADCQMKLQEANARPDYSELSQFFKEHTIVSTEILKGIETLLRIANQLLTKSNDHAS